ncbi:MAG: helix-turn-helix transcriptional regulator [Clostridiales bacterium]|nr:helix-turn-helix transcriptional regulator [Clostridiales bacterium]
MIGEKIKKLRLENSLTQKDLAEKLYVTAQAVSRWENNEVEPSITTIAEIAKVFNISMSELLGEEQQPVKVVKETEYVYKEQKPILAVCEQCNKPIYDGNEIVRLTDYDYMGNTTTKILCKTCDDKNKKQAHETAVYQGIQRRKKSFLWGSIFTVLIVIVALVATLIAKASTGIVVGATVGSLLFFPFLSCLYLDNNFIWDMVETVASWSIRLPGLIFELSLDGIIWLLTVKLLFWILGGLVSILCFILAIILGLAISIFVYPFALSKNLKHPELED